jgi:hypothetical protein
MRCEWSDLEVEHCAHCRGKADPDVEAIDPLEGVRLSDKHDVHESQAFPASERMTCGSCGVAIEAGEYIRGVLAGRLWSDGFAYYVHEECP